MICYICGRDFGKSSISIHIPQCKKKWEYQQNQLPKNERRPIPEEPANFEKILKGEMKQSELREYNDTAFDDYNKKALEECPNCKRTFVPRALEIHLRSCKEPQTSMTTRSRSNKDMTNGKPVKKKTPVTTVNKDRPSKEDLINYVKKEAAFNDVTMRMKLLDIMKDLASSRET